MNEDWVRSAAGRRVLVHWADLRPAWLWSFDGNTLLWRNGAARLFGARLKKSGLKLAADAQPIKGQVSRLIRLGSAGRSSLSRIQFLAGERPISTTCTVTPLELADGQTGALLVGVDPIEADILAAAGGPGQSSAALFPEGAEYLVVGADGRVSDGSATALERYAAVIESQGVPDEDRTTMEIGERAVTFTRFKASPDWDQLLLITQEAGAAPGIASVHAEEGAAFGPASRPHTETVDEPLLPIGLAPIDAPAPSPEPLDDQTPWVDESGADDTRLSSLFDRLADHEPLYGELSTTDEHFVAPPASNLEPPAQPEIVAADPIAESAEPPPAETDVIAAVIEFEDDLAADPSLPVTHRVTGRGFTPIIALGQTPQEIETETPPPATDPEVVERVSRYNFDELGRLLADRVGRPDARPTPPAPVELDPPIEPVLPAPAPPPTAIAEGALINIAAETFVLNRLPLGILVFRDQQVLFANRALTDLVGYETIDGLRGAGIGAIFPGDGTGDAGPVTHLLRRDGTRFPVTARLQSITWQGRPALMLSASPAITQQSHEAAVRAFAELAAATTEDGFVQTDRHGVVTSFSDTVREALGGRDLAGQPLAAFIHPDDLSAFRDFLDRPARFAETVRPSIVLRTSAGQPTIALFSEGQAGIVAGYFGFLRRTPEPQIAPPAPEPEPERDDDDVDPSMLARVTRGVRRPLNTIIGFADLIRSTAFGTVENNRYVEYARDIKTAGQEIAVLVDELDEYARLRAGRYETRPAEIDLVSLLESCLVRVRGQANAARVLLRNGISEQLPHVQGDRASLGQAVLNLLASAIDQTPSGGSVVVSAQIEDDNQILINIRDGGESSVDPGERFVVFRDGVGKDGETLAPVRSSVGLALTRALVAVNGCSLHVSPAGTVGTLFSISIPSELVAAKARA